MVFSSLTFLFFFLPASIIAYVAVHFIFRKSVFALNVLLCGLSLIFYFWGGGETALKTLLTLVVVNYLIGYLIRTKKSKWILVAGIIFNCAMLITSKYPAALLETFNLYMSNGMQLLALAVPLGISFIVFNCISYLVDEYKEARATLASANNEGKNILELSVYLLLFTKITQGPIVQYKEMLPQIRKREFSFGNICAGLERFIIGLAKKVLIADVFQRTTAQMIQTAGLDVPSAWLLVLLYGLQLYFDFSGYSDMALGISKIFGFHFKENFNFPYTSTSISDFWRKWHISLGSWFREYVYIPLGGNRTGNVFVNLFVVFLLTGLWHGNSNIYLCWGIAYGVLIVLERTHWYRSFREKHSWSAAVGWVYTTLVVFLGWICFWCGGVGDFLNFIKVLFGFGSAEIWFTWQYYLTPKIVVLIVLSALGIGILSRPRIQKRLLLLNEQNKVFAIMKYVILLFLFALCFISIVANGYSPFLYFVF